MIKAFPLKVNLSSLNKGSSKNRLYLKNKDKILFPLLNKRLVNRTFVIKNKQKNFSWKGEQSHKGINLYKINKYKILDCINCGFIHAVPIPKQDYLEKYYLKKYYSQKRKLDYFKEQNKTYLGGKIYLKIVLISLKNFRPQRFNIRYRMRTRFFS